MLTKSATIILGIIQEHPINAYELIKVLSTYVFGWSKIADDRTVHFPPMVLTEYDLLEEQEIIIFTGAKITGGFCVTNQKMLSASKLHKILDDLPELKNHGSILAGIYQRPFSAHGESDITASNGH